MIKYTSVLWTGSALALLVLGFIGWFLVPAIRHWFTLRSIQRALRQLPRNSRLGDLKKVFVADGRLVHLWNEFEETLHRQTEDRDGKSALVAIRSTVPAEAYFNSHSVVDSRLRSEFFRHLPGIFTGVGIIGTFSGLILGLDTFQENLRHVNERPTAATDAVGDLLNEVSTAFLVSAAAITAAMVVTFIEKLLLSSLYRQAEDIAHNIDARFDAGAGEEYLSRMVHASEDAASQAKILKDSLVGDLRVLMRDVADAQIKAAREGNKEFANVIAASISDSLSEPLKEIAGTVKVASGDQSATASRLLQDVMASFTQRLNELFGDQIAGLSDLNRSTAGSVSDVAKTLNTLVANIEAASTKSGDAMAARMAEAIEKMEQRQSSINDQTTAFVSQLRELVASSQTETSRRMQEALSALGESLGAMVESLRSANSEALEGNRQREESLAGQATTVVTAMTTSVEGAVSEIGAASVRMQDAVARMTSATSGAIDKMTYGADTLNAASRSFAQAGEGVTKAMSQAASVSGKLAETSGAMTTSASALKDTVAEYRSHREEVATLIAQLHATVEAARTEAALTEDVLARIDSAATKLTSAQQAADRYLTGVNDVLAKSHEAFAQATIKTLDRANTDFHTKLSAAVSLLSSSIQELETTIGSK